MKLTTPLLLSAMMIISASCDDDINNPTTNPTFHPVQFESTEHSLAENAASKAVTINLGNASPVDGLVSLEVTAPNLNSFTTSPAISGGKIALPISSGSRSINFTLTPVDNATLDGNQSIVFTIHSVPNGLSIGTIKTSTIIITDDEQPAQVNFVAGSSTFTEENHSNNNVVITLSSPAPGNGQLEVVIESNDAVYGEHFTTSPGATNGKISLPISTGHQQAKIEIIPINDDRINGNRHISLTITGATGAISKGSTSGHGITIKDDELKGVSKSYSTSAGGWSTRRFYAYNENGQLAKVYWEQYTPGYAGGAYIYHYNGQQLEKMTEQNGIETIYTTENGRIIKSEKFTAGVLTQYTLYGYDDAGNVGETAHYYRQRTTGEMKMGLLMVYLYFTDGNLYKQLTYNPVDENEPVLISTRTYDKYIATANPFPMVEILPNKPTQRHLPGTYRTEENGKDVTYNLSYEFDAEGRLRSRTATSAEGRETTTYNFY